MDQSVSSNHPVIRTLSRFLGEASRAGSNEFRFASPFVGKKDFKKHLYVHPKNGFFCFKSGTGGSISYLFLLLGQEYKEGEEPLLPYVDLLNEIRPGLPSLKKQLVNFAELPDWAVPVKKDSYVHKYLIKRGLSQDDIEYYRIQEGIKDKFGWVVIPTFDAAGKCRYWVSRSVFSKKYKNPQVDRKYHVAFLDQASCVGNGKVVVCEGVFSAIVAGRDAVAVYGKFVTKEQISAIKRSGVTHVEVCLDGDARREALALANRLYKSGIKTRIILLPDDQDPADLGRDLFMEIRKTCYIEYNPYSEMLFRLSEGL